MNIYYLVDHVYDQEYGKGEPLYLNNLGYYEDLQEDVVVSRPQGRLDYHLIYVVGGEVQVGEAMIENGDYCVFAPHEPQNYTYRACKNARYYWFHFTGHQVSAPVSGIHRSNGRQNEGEALCLALVRATKQTLEGADSYVVTLLRALFLLLTAPAPKPQHFSRAKKRLEDLTQPTTIGALAALYDMTEEHFIRSFKGAYGTTPARYRIQHQLTQGKHLLLDTDLPVSTIADLCGIPDPYYFSRLFKKHIGVAPVRYRRETSKT